VDDAIVTVPMDVQDAFAHAGGDILQSGFLVVHPENPDSYEGHDDFLGVS